MRLAFVTDTHFGYRRFEEDALRQGRKAVLSAAAEADALILGGDNFDTPLPRMETLSEVTTVLREALEAFHARGIAGTPILAIHGNHDRRAKGFVHPTELLARGGFLENIHNRTAVVERNGEKVAVSGMGSVPEDLARAAILQLACKPLEGAFNVFVLHQSFQEFDVTGNESFLSFDDLPAGFDLYLCGHVHKPSLSGKVLNPGSTVVTQLKEDESGSRGYLLYDTKTRKAEFRPINSRPFFHKTLEFDNATPDQVKREVEGAVNGLLSQSPGAIVKIVARGTLGNGLRASDIRLPHFGENVFLDNSLNTDNLRERIAQIKLAREKKLSSQELGMQILRKRLEGTSYSLGDPEKVFESLIAGSFLKETRERIEKAGGG